VTFTRTKRVGNRVGDKVTKKVTDNQRKILAYMQNNAHITTRQLSIKIGISNRKIKDNIKKLKEKNLVKRIGSPRSGYWKVMELDEE
jgi:ATP-dependent DNA helicase RecG